MMIIPQAIHNNICTSCCTFHHDFTSLHITKLINKFFGHKFGHLNGISERYWSFWCSQNKPSCS